MSRYGKRVDLVVHEEEPFNAETGLAGLVEGPVTATDAFYVRGHGAVPEIDPAAWRLRVQGAVERELDLSLATLREALRERESPDGLSRDGRDTALRRASQAASAGRSAWRSSLSLLEVSSGSSLSRAAGISRCRPLVLTTSTVPVLSP